MGSILAAGGSDIPTGFKDIFRYSDLAGEEPRTCSYEPMELTLCNDIVFVESREGPGR